MRSGTAATADSTQAMASMSPLAYEKLQAEAWTEALRRKQELRDRKEPWPENHVVGPDELTPRPFHLAQTWAWESERRIVVMSAGSQGGKTGWGPWWLAREIQKRGGGDYLAVTATYDLFKLKMLPALQQVLVDILGIARYWAGDKILELKDPTTGQFKAVRSTDPMWGRVILRSADAKGGLESATAKAAWLDEAGQPSFRIKAWRGIRRRLHLHMGRVLMTTTLYEIGWVKKQIIDAAVDGGEVTLETLDNGAEVQRTDNEAAGICLVQFDSIANPSFPVSEYEDARASMPADEFAMFYRGRVAQLRTRIYDCFDPAVHVVAPFPIPADWPRFVGVDPLGEYVAVVWLAYDATKGQLHVYREYQEPFGVTTSEHARRIRALSASERIAKYIGGGPSERQQRVDWQGAGIPLEAAPISDVWVGIRRVYALFKTLRMVVHGSCPKLIKELQDYHRQRDRAGELTEKIQDKERFHQNDSLRYIIAWIAEPQEQLEISYRPKLIGRQF